MSAGARSTSSTRAAQKCTTDQASGPNKYEFVVCNLQKPYFLFPSTYGNHRIIPSVSYALFNHFLITIVPLVHQSRSEQRSRTTRRYILRDFLEGIGFHDGGAGWAHRKPIRQAVNKGRLTLPPTGRTPSPRETSAV